MTIMEGKLYPHTHQAGVENQELNLYASGISVVTNKISGVGVGMHPSQIFRYLTVGLIVGFIISVFVNLSWVLALVGCLVAGALTYKVPYLKVITLVVIGIFVALIRTNFVYLPLPTAAFIGYQQFEAKVIEPPRVSEKAMRYVVEPLNYPPNYKTLLITKLYPKYSYGDILHITCKQLEPINFSGYVSKGIYRECAFPEIDLATAARPTLQQKLFYWRDLAGNRLRQLLPEPEASLLCGMLWGDDSGLPTELTNAFRRTGTSHLLAVSGYNVMILTEVLFGVLLALGLWRRSASLIVLAVVGMFVLFTGAEPPVVRAGIMGSLVIIGRLLWRKPDDINILLGAASAMLLVSPILIYDFGWQLSFAAMAGLLFLTKPITEQLKFLPESINIREAAAQTLSANLTTLPIILLRVDQLSLVGPVANLLIAPVVVVIFIFGLVVMAASLFLGQATLILAWPLTAALWYVKQVVISLSQLPSAVMQSSIITWILVVVAYGLLMKWLKHKTSS